MEIRNHKMWEEIDRERKRLLSLTPDEVSKLSSADQYQRMRFEREIEGMEYVRLLKQGMDRSRAAEVARENADSIVKGYEAIHGA